MTPSNALIVREQQPIITANPNQLSLTEISKFAQFFASSQYFQDVKEASQAVVKITYGQELGIPPAASMSGIHIVKGKPVLGANMLATLIKKSKYGFKVIELTNEKCTLHFYERNTYNPAKPDTFYTETFTIQDAQRAQLLENAQWKKYPLNMLFARCISNGARFYCSDVFGGTPVYTPEEMGAPVDEDGELVIDITPAPQRPAKTEVLERTRETVSQPVEASKPDGSIKQYHLDRQMREEIIKLAKAINTDATEGLAYFDANPEMRSKCLTKVRRTFIKTSLVNVMTELSDEGKLAYLEDFGITAIDSATDEQIESCATTIFTQFYTAI